MHQFYDDRQFTVIPPSSVTDMGTDTELIYLMLGEKYWNLQTRSPRSSIPYWHTKRAWQ